MPKIAVFGGTGYLASLIKNQNNEKKNNYFFFSRRKKAKNYINYSSFIKYSNTLKKFDYFIHLVGPNQNQLLKNKNLIKKKNQITSDICNFCLKYNIKLIYISSMQIYQNYGKDNLSIGSKINFKSSYSRSHYDSEKIILKKFLNRKNMFLILRIGNVFGFKKYENLREIHNNLIYGFCISALKNKKIIIKNGSIYRSLLPSKIFVQRLNFLIKKNFLKNSIENFFYKNLSLENIAKIIQKRTKLLFNLSINVVINKFNYKKSFIKSNNQCFKFSSIDKKIYFEIDQILKKCKKNNKKMKINGY
jgi:nucleoside-diphosphate-sugar epimerase